MIQPERTLSSRLITRRRVTIGLGALATTGVLIAGGLASSEAFLKEPQEKTVDPVTDFNNFTKKLVKPAHDPSFWNSLHGQNEAHPKNNHISIRDYGMGGFALGVQAQGLDISSTFSVDNDDRLTILYEKIHGNDGAGLVDFRRMRFQVTRDGLVEPTMSRDERVFEDEQYCKDLLERISALGGDRGVDYSVDKDELGQLSVVSFEKTNGRTTVSAALNAYGNVFLSERVRLE